MSRLAVPLGCAAPLVQSLIVEGATFIKRANALSFMSSFSIRAFTMSGPYSGHLAAPAIICKTVFSVFIIFGILLK